MSTRSKYYTHNTINRFVKCNKIKNLLFFIFDYIDKSTKKLFQMFSSTSLNVVFKYKYIFIIMATHSKKLGQRHNKSEKLQNIQVKPFWNSPQ